MQPFVLNIGSNILEEISNRLNSTRLPKILVIMIGDMEQKKIISKTIEYWIGL